MLVLKKLNRKYGLTLFFEILIEVLSAYLTGFKNLFTLNFKLFWMFCPHSLAKHLFKAIKNSYESSLLRDKTKN